MEDDFFDRPKATKTTSKKSYPNVVTDELLNRLEQVESGGKADAVNKESGAEGAYQFLPSTTKMLLAKGIKFDPKNKTEARSAARTYLQQLVDQNEGDIEKALAQYGGFIKKDPTNYVNMVLGKQPIGGTKQESDFFDRPVAPTIKTASGKEEVIPPTPEEKIANQAAFGIYPRVSGRRAVIEKAQKPSTEGMGGSLAAMADVVAGAPSYLLGLAGYGGLRALGRTPEQAAETAYGTAGLISQPVGKLTGTVGTPAYEKDVLTAPLRQFGQYTQTKAKEISQATGIPEQDVEFAINAGMLAAPKVAKTVVPPVAKAVTGAGEVVQNVRGQMAQQLAAKQAPQVAPQPINPQFQSGGAAAVEHVNAIKEALSRNPELQTKYQNVPPEAFTPQDLMAIETHNKFAKFDMVPTEGQALRDTNLMSQEMNARLKDPELNSRIQERDPKLIAGFQKVRETIAPDVFETNPVQLANAPLEKMKADLVNHEQQIRNAFDKANNATGTGESPIDVGELAQNIETALKKKQRTRYVPAELKADLEDALSKGYLTPEEYENFRTDTATIARTHKDPMARQAAYIVREQLENVPLQGEFAQYKPLFDIARDLTKQLKEKEKIPAYRAAASDTRTQEQIDLGVPHPAANTFLEKHFGEKTPQSDIDKMLSIIGKDSPEHQALMAARLDAIKKNSGVVNNQGVVQQKALNKQVFEQYKGNGNVMFGPEKYQELQDLAEVANLSEHVKGRHSVNVSNTEILAEQNRIKEAAKEVAGGFAAGKADVAIQATTGIPMAGTLTRMFLKKKAEQQAAEQALAAERVLSAKRLSPTAGISVEPPRIELNNMLPNRK